MIIQSLIDKKIEPLGLGATLKEVHERIKESGCGAVAFIDEESRPVGILTERDISRLLFEGCGFDDLAFPLAIKELVVSQENRDLEYVLSLMTGNNIRRIVICNKVGQYSGIITQDTIFHELGEEIYKTKLRARHLINAKNLIHKITPGHSLKEALSLMVENKIGTLPMLGEGERIWGCSRSERLSVWWSLASLWNRLQLNLSTRNPTLCMRILLSMRSLIFLRKIAIPFACW